MYSIITDTMDRCYFCERTPVEIHHIIFRSECSKEITEKYGMVIPLCHEHHLGNNSPHRNRNADLYLKGLATRLFKEKYPELDFRETFGKEYV